MPLFSDCPLWLPNSCSIMVPKLLAKVVMSLGQGEGKYRQGVDSVSICMMACNYRLWPAQYVVGSVAVVLVDLGRSEVSTERRQPCHAM